MTKKEEGLYMAIMMLANVARTITGPGRVVATRAKIHLFRQVEAGSKCWEMIVKDGLAS